MSHSDFYSDFKNLTNKYLVLPSYAMIKIAYDNEDFFNNAPECSRGGRPIKCFVFEESPQKQWRSSQDFYDKLEADFLSEGTTVYPEYFEHELQFKGYVHGAHSTVTSSVGSRVNLDFDVRGGHIYGTVSNGSSGYYGLQSEMWHDGKWSYNYPGSSNAGWDINACSAFDRCEFEPPSPGLYRVSPEFFVDLENQFGVSQGYGLGFRWIFIEVN